MWIGEHWQVIQMFAWNHFVLGLIVDFVTFKGHEDQQPMWKHVIDWSHSIEVNYKPDDGKAILSKVYFPFDPKVHKIRGELNYLI